MNSSYTLSLLTGRRVLTRLSRLPTRWCIRYPRQVYANDFHYPSSWRLCTANRDACWRHHPRAWYSIDAKLTLLWIYNKEEAMIR